MPKLYSALPTATSIRLLLLQPSIHAEQISCSLLILPELNLSATYIALSYRWGDANDMSILSCNGVPTPVTKNLYAALHQLRDKTQTRIIWADAICINQNDNEERSQQVSIMRQIYSLASKVYIWIGHGDASSERALDLIRSVSHGCCRAAFGADSSSELWLEKLRTDSDRARIAAETKMANLIELEAIPAKHWRQVWQLFQREWFYRSWVIQEVRACPDTWMLCGAQMIEWSFVGLAVNWLQGCQYRDTTKMWRREHFPEYGGFNNTIFMWNWPRRTRREAPLPAMLSLTRSFHASDPRDKVFAMLQQNFSGQARHQDNPSESVSLSQPKFLHSKSY
jgi:hypothetical protein